MKFQIISDSSCDLAKSYVEEKQIDVIPFYVSFDGETYYKEGVEIDHDQFYMTMMNDKVFPKTSLPSIQDYVEVFTVYAKEQIPVICICITTKFSGSFQSASTAKDIILETYPNAQVTVIDSTINTVLQGIYVREAIRMRENGLSYEETIKELERIKSTGRIIFTISEMDYLKKGGRVGRLLSFASGSLGIKPLIVLKEGEIFPAGICRSRNKSKAKLLDIAKDYFAKSGENPNDYVFVIGTGIDYEEAEEFKMAVEEALGITITLDVATIGVTIGTHTGPHPIGMAFVKKYDA